MSSGDDELRRRLAPPTGTWHPEEGLRDAAVLVPIVAREGGDRLVFNRRRDDLPWHAGQVCFPGGARDPDESAIECALRETHEEMGVDPASVTVLGRLPDRVSIAGFRVAVLVGRVVPEASFRVHEVEVAEVFEVPCARLVEPARWSFRPSTSPRARLARIPYFESGSHVVWGLTGIILRDFVRAALAFDPPDVSASPG